MILRLMKLEIDESNECLSLIERERERERERMIEFVLKSLSL